MKKLLCLLLIMACTLLTGCGNGKVDSDMEVLVNEADQDGNTSENEEQKENIEGEERNLEEDFSFAEFKNLNFTFLSGAGGWATVMTIAEDGTFEGVYEDSDAGESRYCSFHGKFTEPVRKDEYIYATTIESISYDHPVGTEEIKDGRRYIYTDVYGLDNPEEILIYIPGMPIEDLPEGYLSWVRSNWFMDSEFTKTETKLPFYGLYNVSEEQGFSSYNILEEMEKSVESTDWWTNSIEGSIKSENLSQAEINEKSQFMYDLWDNQLNKVWDILKKNLDEEAMADLTKEQLEWIAWKEQDMKDAGAEVEGGSMYGMVIYQRGAKLTKERVYELMEIAKELIEEANFEK